MGTLIKEEFKGFIKELSNEICREVLVTEFKEINREFNETKIKYEKEYEKYSRLVEKMDQKLVNIEKLEKKLEEESRILEKHNQVAVKLLSDTIDKFEINRKTEMKNIEYQISNNLMHLLDMAKTIENKGNEERLVMEEYNSKFKNELNKLVGVSKVEEELLLEIKGLKRNNGLLLNFIKKESNLSRREIAMSRDDIEEEIIDIIEKIKEEILEMKRKKIMIDGKFKYKNDDDVIESLKRIRGNLYRTKELEKSGDRNSEKTEIVKRSFTKLFLHIKSIRNEIDKLDEIKIEEAKNILLEIEKQF